MGFRQETSDWFFKRFLWSIFVGIVIFITLIFIFVVGLIDILLSPIELIISWIRDESVLMWFTSKFMNLIDNPIFKKIDEFENKHIKG